MNFILYGQDMPGIKHTFRIMKMTLISLFACICTLFATEANSQNAKVSIQASGFTIQKVINEIEKQTDFLFVYDKNEVNVNRKVSINVNEESVSEVLNKIFENTNVAYRVLGKNITLIVRPESASKLVLQPQQKQKRITGTIVDAKGEPIIGANVVEKGTTNGIITDVDGKFSFEVNDNAILSVSYIGYIKQEIGVKGKFSLNVILKEDAETLDEIVVVGYGTQKRINLTGAVEQVTDKVFNNRPMANVTQGLQGAIPNLNITLSDGKPMRTADFNVRGTTSIGQGGSALVLIDGVEGDPSLLNPNDIASVSVLKDASSAAIYGARAAFGVVLITTKNPTKEHTSVTYTGNFSIKSPTVVPDMVTDGYVWATMFLDSYQGYNNYTEYPSKIHKAMKFSQDWYNELANRRPGSGADEVVTNSNGTYTYYGNTDWYDLLYKDHTLGIDHNITVQGGGEKADFFVSGHYYGQDGVFNYNSDDYKMYNVRAKGSVELFPWLKVENNMEFSQMNFHNPLTVSDGNVWYGLEGENQPVVTMFNPDGTLTMGAAYGVGEMFYGKSGTDYEKRILRNTTGFTAKFLNNALRVKGDITFRNTDDNNSSKRVPVPYSTQAGTISYLGSSTNDYMETNKHTKYLATNLYAEYEKNLAEDHYLKGMIGYNYEQSIYKDLFTRRNGLIFEDAKDISMTNGSAVSIASNYYKWRIAGGFYRLNYSFKNRYLFEASGRVDGSTKFPANQQWAFFPSFSAGWRVSEEPFWKISKKVLSDLKLRASYGSLGNGNVNAYAYNELFSIFQMDHLIKRSLDQATSQPTIIPNSLTWETATTTNMGVDMSFLNGRLRLSGDYYIRKTTDMYTVGTTLPSVFGATVPKGNYADMTTRGYEITLNWNDRFNLFEKPFNYDVRLTLSDYVSKIDRYNNSTKNLDDYYEGETLGEIWGYVVEGFFTSDEDVANHADQTLIKACSTGAHSAGDIKFKDLNNDRVINYGDNTVDNSGDKKVIGNSNPRYIYSINLGADWNGFFVSTFFQGVGKQDWWAGRDNSMFFGQYNRPYSNVPSSMIGDIWSEDNPNAYFPRYRGYAAQHGSSELSVPSSKYLQNVAYVRLKNVQVGYNLPSSITEKLKMQAARVYLSGENLFSWSPLYKHTKNIDVASIYGRDTEEESMTNNNGGTNSILSDGGSTYNYPLLKSITMGISLTF